MEVLAGPFQLPMVTEWIEEAWFPVAQKWISEL
jgi:hypothetical protein